MPSIGNRNYDYKFDPKNIDRMPPGHVYLYGISPLNELIPIVITFKYIDEKHAMLKAVPEKLNKSLNLESSLTCSTTDIGNLALFFLENRKPYIYFDGFRTHALSLLKDLASQLAAAGYKVLDPASSNDLSGYTGTIEHSSGDIVGTFESVSVQVPDVLVPESKLLQITLKDVVLKPDVAIKSVGNLGVFYNDYKNGQKYEISGLSSIRIKKESLDRIDASISKISVSSIPVEDRPFNKKLPNPNSGRYGSVLYAREIVNFLDERYKIIGINTNAPHMTTELPVRLVEVATGGMSK